MGEIFPWVVVCFRCLAWGGRDCLVLFMSCFCFLVKWSPGTLFEPRIVTLTTGGSIPGLIDGLLVLVAVELLYYGWKMDVQLPENFLKVSKIPAMKDGLLLCGYCMFLYGFRL